MVFGYTKVIVSGTRENVEGVSAALVEISTFMQSVGWVLVDNRSAEPGTAIDATHMKYVFSSNGEENNYPTFFTTLYSGISVLTDSSSISMSMHTAYDANAHTTPASGVRSTSSAIGSISQTLNVRSQDDDVAIYMSGDSEMVHLITARQISNNNTLTISNVYFGRINSFMTLDENPFPLIMVGTNANTIITTATSSNITGVGGNPIKGFNTFNEMKVIATTIADDKQPYNLGNLESVFFANPLIVTYEDTLPIAKGIAGTIRNGWQGADGTHMLNFSILTASGSFEVQTYQAFIPADGGVFIPSIIIRKS